MATSSIAAFHEIGSRYFRKRVVITFVNNLMQENYYLIDKKRDATTYSPRGDDA